MKEKIFDKAMAIKAWAKPQQHLKEGKTWIKDVHDNLEVVYGDVRTRIRVDQYELCFGKEPNQFSLFRFDFSNTKWKPVEPYRYAEILQLIYDKLNKFVEERVKASA